MGVSCGHGLKIHGWVRQGRRGALLCNIAVHPVLVLWDLGIVTEDLKEAAFQFATLCADKAVPAGEIVAAFHQSILLAGYTHAVAGAFLELQGGKERSRFYFNSLPDAWMAALTEHRQLYDVRLNGSREATRRLPPFESLALQRGQILSRLEQKSFDLTTGYGWKSIFVVPVHGPHGYRGVVSIMATKEVSLTAPVRAALRLLCLEVHDRCWAEQGMGLSGQSEPNLTLREVTCLQGVAMGLADKEIARKQGLSPETVRDHIERAKTKLGAKSRAQAVALLVLLGRV